MQAPKEPAGVKCFTEALSASGPPGPAVVELRRLFLGLIYRACPGVRPHHR
jgi:hypothetical protein